MRLLYVQNSELLFFKFKSLVVYNEEKDFQHILRILNSNIDGRQKVMYALTDIKGIGRRFANVVCKKAGIDMRKRCDLLFVLVE